MTGAPATLAPSSGRRGGRRRHSAPGPSHDRYVGQDCSSTRRQHRCSTPKKHVSQVAATTVAWDAACKLFLPVADSPESRRRVQHNEGNDAAQWPPDGLPAKCDKTTSGLDRLVAEVSVAAPPNPMEYNGGMSKPETHPTKCNADRSQRRRCVYYHEKTGRCSRPADDSTWQARIAASGSPPKD